MSTIHITTPEISFDILVPAAQATVRAKELETETQGTVVIQ